MTALAAHPHGPIRTEEDPDLAVWPRSAHALPDGDVALGGVSLAAVADQFGTPVYVVDEDEVRARARAYRQAFPGAGIHYAAKAFLSRGLAAWVHDEGLGVDVCSAGELQIALDGGVPAEDILVHGSAKTPAELRVAVHSQVGRIVVDGLPEITRIAALVPRGRRQRVLIRVVPGIAAGAHRSIRTGTTDQHLGLAAADGAVVDAVARILAQPALQLVGLHCHLGSQIADAAPFVQAAGRMVALTAMVRDRFGVVLPEIDLGGGHAVPYRPGDPGLDIADLGRQVTGALHEHSAAHDLPAPRLLLEPGRAVIGPAMVAVYRVVTVKRTPQRTWVIVDGGMSDNPRPALYGQRYAPRLVGPRPSRAAPEIPMTVVGRHCEAGDVVATDIALPADVRGEDLVAVPVAGAYHLSMASTYNVVGRPPVVAVRAGRARTLVRRETLADLVGRDIGR